MTRSQRWALRRHMWEENGERQRGAETEAELGSSTSGSESAPSDTEISSTSKEDWPRTATTTKRLLRPKTSPETIREVSELEDQEQQDQIDVHNLDLELTNTKRLKRERKVNQKYSFPDWTYVAKIKFDSDDCLTDSDEPP
ncbi:hypothetical protein NDU88_005806 [Pleurodeles waltl]|uniref:Uncharacterized protein n=1 Tax=Pleurodeles waltl TaxID=8319 RepID=A0AAV7MAG5_PLEWA|nr:hypothetical protein NDU88_005806 [Pleurodeles waltl]